MLRFSIGWVIAVVSLLILSNSAVTGLNAQENLPAVVAGIERDLGVVEAKIGDLSGKVDENASNDAALAELKLQFETLSDELLVHGSALRPHQMEVLAQLIQLGDPPSEGQANEAANVSQRRKTLTDQRAQFNDLVGRAERAYLQANSLAGKIVGLRSDLFSQTLFTRSEISPSYFRVAGEALSVEWAELSSSIASWARFAWSFKRLAMLSAIFLSLLAALILFVGGRKVFGDLIDRDEADLEPSYISRLTVAFFSTLIPTIAGGAFAAITILLLSQLNVLRGDIGAIFQLFAAFLVSIYFIWMLTRGVFAPRLPAWRLVNVSHSGAWVLTSAAVALALVNGLDFLTSGISRVMLSPVELTVAKSFIAAILTGLILIAVSRARPLCDEDDDRDQPGKPWPNWVQFLFLAAGVSIILMALTGYVGLAKFVSTQIVVTGAILVVMYLGYLAAQAISEPGEFGNTRIGQYLARQFRLEQVGLDQTGLAAGLATQFIVLILGIPLIMLQWGFRVEDLQTIGIRLLTDIEFGNFKISLVDILFGIVLFVIGLVVTRLFQRWLDDKVMQRSRVETGVRNSIRTGVGYLGVAIAGLIGISAAGLDLSNLALVAGALSLGIGFGLQNIVSNFVSGLILLAERPFKVGDWIVSGSAEGFVKRISVRATEIETFQRQSIIVPNSELINAAVGNWTHRNNLGRAEIPIGVSYDADPQQVMDIMLEIAMENDLVMRNPEPFVVFNGFGDSSLDFELRVYLYDVLNGLSVRNAIRLEIFKRFNAANIEIPFPQRDLNIKIADQEKLASGLEQSIKSPNEAVPKRAGDTELGGEGDIDGSPGGDGDAR